MSDLQCAARVFVARHGEADYESELLSDAGGWLTPLGRDQAGVLAASVSGERIARVWTSDMARAVQTGEIVAAQLGTDVIVRTGLREFGVGDAAGTTGDPDPFAETFAAWLDGDLAARIPGGESGTEVVERYAAVLDEIADSHRGESVLVISHGGVMCMALSALARNLTLSHSRDLPVPHCEVVAVEADADGWVARSWAGRPITWNDR
ncbi:probable phosphoglycerate mutase [Nocardioides alpinus]|uniref:Probable phosphoglycerate mutase n=1 Tax=Nocardioides alpinus TaxID=748909 RepID=A0A1I0Y3A0_9ACTN|nr:histidine phosphatase family protein [Nocardioides alpinus]SFB06693.1 probable phosphoglycerate mutase [Nocardioides alpinus]